MYKGSVTQKNDSHKLAIITVWKILHGPFPIPRHNHRNQREHRNSREMGHQCSNHWQVMDIDIAGCVLCGNIHVCGHATNANSIDTHENINNNINNSINNKKKPKTIAHERAITSNTLKRTGCPTTTEDGFKVCNITGYCLEANEYADTEFIDTVAFEAQLSPKPPLIEYTVILEHIREIICSKTTETCLRHENTKLGNRISNVVFRMLREHKQQNHTRLPNLVTITRNTVANMQNLRMCPRRYTRIPREKVAAFCAKSIVRLLLLLQRMCPHVVSPNKHQGIVAGLLYLMRSGLNMHGVTVLPVDPTLQYLLPPEAQLQPYFGIRSKCITETENLVKVNLRNINIQTFQTLGLNHTDEVIRKA